MDARILDKLESLFDKVEQSEISKTAIDNQRIINELASIGLASLKGSDVDARSRKESEEMVKHADVAKEFGCTVRRISDACKDGRIKRWISGGKRIKLIPRSEVERVRPVLSLRKDI